MFSCHTCIHWTIGKSAVECVPWGVVHRLAVLKGILVVLVRWLESALLRVASLTKVTNTTASALKIIASVKATLLMSWE